MLAAQTLAPAIPVFPLAALPSAPATTSTTAFRLAANPHQGVRRSVATWQLGPLPGNPQMALGMPVCLYDSGRRSRDSGKERDSETNLDFFEARYYSGAQGRFTSPDEFKGGIVDPFTGQDIETNTALPYADITNPQTLNKYAYVMNNPLRYTDPTGHIAVVDDLVVGVAVGVTLGAIYLSHTDAGRAVIRDTVSALQSADRAIGNFFSQQKADANKSNAPPAVEPAKAEKASTNTNPYAGPVSGPVTVVDPKGNAIPVKTGEQVQGSKDGKYTQVKDADGNATGTRVDGGHKPSTHPDPRAQEPHAHVPGRTNPDGTPWLPINH